MKYVTMLFLFISFYVSTFGQDIIWKKTGEKIEAKVFKISPSEIEYKTFSHLDGPIRVISKSSVLQIEYESGEVEEFDVNPIPLYRDGYAGDTFQSNQWMSTPQQIKEVNGKFYANSAKIGRRTIYRWLVQLQDPNPKKLYDKSLEIRNAGAALGFGAIVPAYGGILIDFFSERVGYATIPGFAIAAPMLVGSRLLHRLYRKKQREAINKYNEALATQENPNFLK